MPIEPKQILTAIITGSVSGVSSAVAKDLYQALKEFLQSRSDVEKKSLIKTSFKKPDTFVAFELDCIASQSASYLLSMPPSERSRIIELAKQRAGNNEEQILLHLIHILHDK